MTNLEKWLKAKKSSGGIFFNDEDLIPLLEKLIKLPAGKFVKKITTADTGGHVLVDMVTLKNGVVIGVTDESVVVYGDERAFWDGDPEIGDVDISG